jgi:hypothetical protein
VEELVRTMEGGGREADKVALEAGGIREGVLEEGMMTGRQADIQEREGVDGRTDVLEELLIPWLRLEGEDQDSAQRSTNVQLSQDSLGGSGRERSENLQIQGEESRLNEISAWVKCKQQCSGLQ